MTLRVAFRVDSSLAMGLGHLIRCLALAELLRKSGADCHFVCRNFFDDRCELVQKQGFKLSVLSPAGSVPGNLLGVTPEVDANETLQVLANYRPDWLIVDHYALNKDWEAHQADNLQGLRIMIISDRPDRPHHADIVLDQTCGRKREEYDGLLPDTALCYFGADYAVLRPEFTQLRTIALQRRAKTDASHILISFGGGDALNELLLAIGALTRLAPEFSFSVSLVLGDTSLRTPALLQKARSLSIPIDIIDYADNLPEIMARADIAVGAAGYTALERCCLGLPSVVLTLAENQYDIAEALAKNGACLSVASTEKAIADALEKLLKNPKLRLEMAHSASTLCDGKGAKRLMERMFA